MTHPLALRRGHELHHLLRQLAELFRFFPHHSGVLVGCGFDILVGVGRLGLTASGGGGGGGGAGSGRVGIVLQEGLAV